MQKYPGQDGPSSYLAAKSGKESERGFWLPLWMHAMDTAETCRRFVRERVSDGMLKACGLTLEELKKLVVFLGLVHDIGKATMDFQKMIALHIDGHIKSLVCAGLLQEREGINPHKGKVKHPIAGEAILLFYGCPASVAAIVGAHHGAPASMIADPIFLMEAYGTSFYGEKKEAWEAIWKEWIQSALSYAGYESVEELPEINQSTQLLISGMLSVCDWIASNTFFFPLIQKSTNPQNEKYPQRAETAWKRAAFPKRWQPNEGQVGPDWFRSCFGFEPNLLQDTVLRVLQKTQEPGLLLIEAPMGGGKTEAALAAAEVLAKKRGMGGLYIGLPTKATASGMFPRIKKWAENQTKTGWKSIALLHGAKRQNTEYRETARKAYGIAEDMPGVAVHPWMENGRTGLLSDFATGTVDQFLMAALKRKHVAMRLLGLAGKVSIIDECHAYDSYMNLYLDRCLMWLARYGVPVVLMSATLTKERRQALVRAYLRGIDTKAAETALLEKEGYPLITWTDKNKVFQEKIQLADKGRRVDIRKISPKNACKEILQRISKGGCAGIILNTVVAAQNLAKQVRETGQAEVILLHSQFTDSDRAAIEADILRRTGKDSKQRDRDGLIVIGTQVLEQSLDVDFDIEVVQPCPMDLFLQRIGRLFRHPWRERPEGIEKAECLLMTDGWPLDPGTRAVYYGWTLLSSMKAMPNAVNIPDDIPRLVESVYSARPENMGQEAVQLYHEFLQRKREKEDDAETFCLETPPRSSNIEAMHGLLDADRPGAEEEAATAVRDGVPCMTVILLVRDPMGELRFPDWLGGDTVKETDVDKILGQQLRLPQSFTKDAEEISKALTKKRMQLAPGWENIPELKTALLLVVNEKGEGNIGKYSVSYTREYGLVNIG